MDETTKKREELLRLIQKRDRDKIYRFAMELSKKLRENALATR